VSDCRIHQPDLPIDLDDTSTFGHLDSAGMLRLAQAFPAHCRRGLEIGEATRVPPHWGEGLRSIVCVGMGGSAIGGDLLAGIFEDRAPCPISVVRYYELPRHVDGSTLVIAASYSGNTEEVLSAARQALERRARLVGVCSGGALRGLCEEAEAPVAIVPGGQPPRASTGYLLMPMVALLGQLGLVGDIAQECRETLDLLEALSDELGPTSALPDNRAKQLACTLYGKFPILYASTPMLAPVAFRWRTQINENSKSLAMCQHLPELNHNEVVGWEKGPALLHEPVVVVIASPSDPPRMRRRLALTQEIIGDKAPVYIEGARGRSRLAQVASAMYLGDFMSLYLAFLNGVDPVTIVPIDFLKSRLKEEPLEGHYGA
jgi:glucose/mannose-6-phosphate isomerase